MAYATLRDFVNALDAAGELHRITTPVSCILEVAEIADRVSKSPAASLSPHAPGFDPVHHHQGGKALLFENVTTPTGPASTPLLINAFGSYRRMEMALGCEDEGFDGMGDRIGELVKPQPPVGVVNKIKKGLELAKVASRGPKIVGSARCQDIVQTGDDIDLNRLPILKCWPLDGDPQSVDWHLTPEQAGTAGGDGRYITLAGVYTQHPDDAGKPDSEPRPSRNIGMYRAQLLGPRHTAMHWHVHHDGASHWRAWKKHHAANPSQTAKGMPAAIVLGGESVLPYGATAPLPPGISELLFAGFLNDKSIPLVKCKTIDLHVPANAEIVIEGYVSTEAKGIGMTSNDIYAAQRKAQSQANTSEEIDIRHPSFEDAFRGGVLEGPFGDHTGFYSLPDRYPVFTATAVTHCREPIYPTTIVGYPPQEDYYLGKATERLFLPLLKTLVHDIIDYHLPRFGCFHNCAFLKIDKQYPLQARRVMHAIWGAGQMAWTKCLIVVDEHVNVHDHEQVMFEACSNVDPGRDLEIVHGPLDILDHAAPHLGAGCKIGIDATRKIPGEETNGRPLRPFPPALRMTDDIRRQVDQRWAEYGL